LSEVRKKRNRRQINLTQIQPPKPAAYYENSVRSRKIVTKRKQDLLNEEKKGKIERENKILLEKLSGIIRGTSPSIKNEVWQPKRRAQSLNGRVRRKELLRITKENKSILERLKNKKSSYDAKRWNAENTERERLLRNMCEYPYNLVPNRNNVKTAKNSSRSSGKFGSRHKVKREYSEAENSDKFGLSVDGESRKIEKLNSCKKPKKFGNSYYLLEVTLVKGKLKICADHTENNEKIYAEVPLDKSIFFKF